MGGELVFVLVVLFSIVRGLFIFFRWAVRGLTQLGATSQTFNSQYQPAALSPRMPAQFAPTRIAEAGGPSVSREATTDSFRIEEEDLVRSEPTSASTLTQYDVPATPPSNAPLFDTSSDFLRAFILREALGTPLSRQQRR